MADARPLRLYDVPAGTRVSKCRGPRCGVDIYFIKNDRGTTSPIDVRAEFGGMVPTPTDPGKGILHFLRCPDANVFTKKSPPPAPEPKSEQRDLPIASKPARCVICFCHEGQRCDIPKATLDSVEQDVHIGRLDVNGPADLPATVKCYWIQLDPYVCSACKHRRGELPLRMRAGKEARSA